jgi:MFS family permease
MLGPIRQNTRVLTAALVGTTVEFYDFYIFATATALVFGPMFFPQAAPGRQVLLAFLTFGIAFMARPFGAVAFGHFGDRVGRKATLVVSLMLMGSSTLLIAFLPGYAALARYGLGWLAPVLLCGLRFGQGFGLGGEWGGAALLAVENAPKGWQSRFGAAPQLGAPLGFLAANGLFLLIGLILSPADFAAWGWRIPFLASALLVMLGLWVRLRITETPAFRAAVSHAPPPAVPLARLLSHHGGAVLAGSAGVVACFATFYLATAFALAQGTGPLGYSRVAFLSVQLAANVFLALGIALAAVWSDRTSPGRVLAWGAALTIPIGLVFGAGLASGSLLVVFATLASALFVMGLTYGPLGSWLPSLFPVPVRYTGISVAFNVGGIIGGAVTPFGAKLWADHGHGASVGLLLSAAGLLTLLGISLARPARETAAAR